MNLLARLRILWAMTESKPAASMRGLCARLPGEPDTGLVAYRRPDGMWAMNTVGVTDPEAAEQLYRLADAMTDRVFADARARKARKG